MAAKGEQVDLSELAQTEIVNNDTKVLKDDQESLPVNGTSKATVKQPQTVAGARPASNPTTTAPSDFTAQVAPATTTGAPVMGTAMPQALLNTGTSQRELALSY
jgi:molybdopterin-biosynthesis enzyme MoeA-like protein